MITSIKQEIKKKESNLLKSDLNLYLVDKDQITVNSKRMWFKGSRYR